MFFFIAVGFFIFSGISSLSFAQEVIVEATAISDEEIEPSRSATVLHLEKDALSPLSKDQTVADALKEVVGVEVVKQGAVGQTTSVFIRGARSEDTLVLIDGAEVNDAMSPAGGYDFSTLSPENIERIEVYRGPQSVRFGAGALGGVINIITRKGRGKPQYGYFGEGGSFSTYREALSGTGRIGQIGYSIAGDYLSTQGFSAASENLGNLERDGAKIGSASGRLDWALTPTANLGANFRYSGASVDLDAHGGRGGDDPNDKVKSKQLVAGIVGTERFFSDQVKTSLGAYFSTVDREGHQKPSAENQTHSGYRFLGETRKLQSETDWIFGEPHTLKLILAYRDEAGRSDSSYNGICTKIPRQRQSVVGTSLTYLLDTQTWFFDAGLRADQSSKVGTIASYRTSLGRRFPHSGTRTFLSYGTGYKLPSLYQLYSIYGNENLKQENGTTLEATVEQKLARASSVFLTAFENRFHDMIDYNLATNRYFNLSTAKSYGLELQTSLEVAQGFSLLGGYTYLRTRDENTGLPLLRRPQNAWTFSVRYSRGVHELYSQYFYRGSRDDLDPNTFQRIQMSPYSVVSLGGSTRLKRWLKLHARLENLLNEEYEEVAGYGTPGRSFYMGLSGEF